MAAICLVSDQLRGIFSVQQVPKRIYKFRTLRPESAYYYDQNLIRIADSLIYLSLAKSPGENPFYPVYFHRGGIALPAELRALLKDKKTDDYFHTSHDTPAAGFNHYVLIYFHYTFSFEGKTIE